MGRGGGRCKQEDTGKMVMIPQVVEVSMKSCHEGRVRAEHSEDTQARQ